MIRERFFNCRMWWEWQGDFPKTEVVSFMAKNFPPDWTYADFAQQFRAELFGSIEFNRTVFDTVSIRFRSK